MKEIQKVRRWRENIVECVERGEYIKEIQKVRRWRENIIECVERGGYIKKIQLVWGRGRRGVAD